MKRKLILLIACVWFSTALPGASCLAQAVPVLSQIASVLINAKTELDRVDVIVQDYFRLTNASDETRQRYSTIKTNVLRGINIANSTLQGLQDIDQKQYDAAITEFSKAWDELQAFLKDTGALNVAGNKLSSGPGGVEVEMPEPAALTYKVADDG